MELMDDRSQRGAVFFWVTEDGLQQTESELWGSFETTKQRDNSQRRGKGQVSTSNEELWRGFKRF